MKIKGKQLIPIEIDVSSYELVDAMIKHIRAEHHLDARWYLDHAGNGKVAVMQDMTDDRFDDTFIRVATDEDIQVFGLIDQLKGYYGT